VPGCGIGGLYYVVLAFVMPACETYQLVRGRSSPKRWRQVGIQAANAAGILAALALGAWLVCAACYGLIQLVSGSASVAAARQEATAQHLRSVAWYWIPWLSAVTLAVVIILPAMLAVVVSLLEYRRRKSKSPQPPTNPSAST
jgi:hypothetical protein